MSVPIEAVSQEKPSSRKPAQPDTSEGLIYRFGEHPAPLAPPSPDTPPPFPGISSFLKGYHESPRSSKSNFSLINSGDKRVQMEKELKDKAEGNRRSPGWEWVPVGPGGAWEGEWGPQEGRDGV